MELIGRNRINFLIVTGQDYISSNRKTNDTGGLCSIDCYSPLGGKFNCSSSCMVIVVFIYTFREIKHDVFTQTSSDIQTSYGVSSEYDN